MNRYLISILSLNYKEIIYIISILVSCEMKWKKKKLVLKGWMDK